MTKKPKKIRRVVLGVGHPWFLVGQKGQAAYDTVRLTTTAVAQSVLMRGGEEFVPFKFSDVGNWNKVRLVLEVLK